jgi:hypothetical protein
MDSQDQGVLNFIKSTDAKLDKYLKEDEFYKNIIKGIISLFVILYAARVAPNLPVGVMEFLDKPLVKFFIFAAIIYTANVSPSIAMALALAFMFSINKFQGRKFYEFLENIEEQSAGTSKLKDSKEEAIEEGVTQMKQEMESAEQVSHMKQSTKTVMIKPEVVDTPTGKAVINPTVVVSPSVVEDESGQKVAVKPDVTIIDQQDQVPEKPELEIPEKPEMEKKEKAPSAKACYPTRQYDMKLVKPFSSSDQFKQL